MWKSRRQSCKVIFLELLLVIGVIAGLAFSYCRTFSKIFIRDTCSWKGQLERTRSWKVLSWKVWSWKVWPKLERTERSWKEPSEVGKNWAKLERTQRSWKEPSEVGKFFFKLESFAEVGKFRCSWKVLAEVGKFKDTLTVLFLARMTK